MARLWGFRKTKQDHSGAEKFAYKDFRQRLLYQNIASPWGAPIVKNLAPMQFIKVFQGPNIMVNPAVLTSGYGGLVAGQVMLQPLQDQSASSGGL